MSWLKVTSKELTYIHLCSKNLRHFALIIPRSNELLQYCYVHFPCTNPRRDLSTTCVLTGGNSKEMISLRSPDVTFDQSFNYLTVSK